MNTRNYVFNTGIKQCSSSCAKYKTNFVLIGYKMAEISLKFSRDSLVWVLEILTLKSISSQLNSFVSFLNPSVCPCLSIESFKIFIKLKSDRPWPRMTENVRAWPNTTEHDWNMTDEHGRAWLKHDRAWQIMNEPDWSMTDGHDRAWLSMTGLSMTEHGPA